MCSDRRHDIHLPWQPLAGDFEKNWSFPLFATKFAIFNVMMCLRLKL